MKRPLLISFLLFFLFCTNLFSQNKTIDSLEKILQKKNLSVDQQINTYNRLYQAYKWKNFSKAYSYIQKAKPLFNSTSNTRILVKANLSYGNAIVIKGNYNLALKYLLDAVNLANKLNDIHLITDCYLLIGEAYRGNRDYENAFKYLIDGLNLARNNGLNNSVKKFYNRLSAVYYENDNFNKTRKYADSAIYQFQEFNNDSFLVEMYTILGAFFTKTYQYDSALIYFNLSIKHSENYNDQLDIINTYINLAALNTRLNRNKEALKWGYKALNLAKKNGVMAYIQGSEFQLYYTFRKMNQWDSALIHYEIGSNFTWKIFIDNRDQTIAEAESRFQVIKNQKEQQQLRLMNEIQHRRIANQRLFIIIVVLLIVFAGITAYLLNRKRGKLTSINKLLEKQNEEIFSKSKEFEELNKTKDKLLSIIAHDLRNPFQAIIGFSNLLKEELDATGNKNIIQYSEYISQGTENINFLLENLLKWSMLQSGSYQIVKEPLNLRNLVQNVVSLFEPAYKYKNLSLENKITPTTEVLCDLTAISTVMRNLISNAIKFSNEHGKIRIDAVEKNSMIEISINDNGIGMTQNQIQKLFLLEKELKKGTKNETGSGLGLILCMEFILKNDGEIWVNSTPEKGTTFTISLPKA